MKLYLGNIIFLAFSESYFLFSYDDHTKMEGALLHYVEAPMNLE
jgi:hypothetical protein